MQKLHIQKKENNFAGGNMQSLHDNPLTHILCLEGESL